MPAALYPTVIDVLQWAANRFGNQLLDYAAKDAWSALKRMLVQAALAEAERRRESRPLETETEVWEITREEFQRELVGRH